MENGGKKARLYIKYLKMSFNEKMFDENELKTDLRVQTKFSIPSQIWLIQKSFHFDILFQVL